jgi:pyruvate ferredoxin oxidoreductase beta subunit
MNYKELALKINKQNRLVSGHRTCAGCPIGIILRTVMAACESDVVVTSATSCAEVTTTIYPYTSWNIPWMHSVFANAAATISGIETAYKSLKKQGKIKKKIKFMGFGGDGGSFDIGLQSLSGALERGHDFVYVCYNNEAYQNTGNQRSSATPYGTSTTTTPSGKESFGKTTFSKDLTEIAIAHNIPYVAQANPGNILDLYNKAKKAFETPGPAVIVVFAACPTNMKAASNKTIEISKKAIESNFWPLYEVENGKYKINYKPQKRINIEEFLSTQTKFKEVLKNKKEIEFIQKHIDDNWNKLLDKEKISNYKK